MASGSGAGDLASAGTSSPPDPDGACGGGETGDAEALLGRASKLNVRCIWNTTSDFKFVNQTGLAAKLPELNVGGTELTK